MDKLKLVKGIVVLLSSFIILGIAAVIIGLMSKDDNKKVISPAPSIPFSAETVTFANPSETIITEPKGSKIATVTSCSDNICLMITGGGLENRLIILNEKGMILHKVKISAD